MIKQQFKVKRRYWKVYVYYDIHKKDIKEIITKIKDLNLPYDYAKSAYTMLSKSKLNCGLTYTNLMNKCTILVIGQTSTKEEFVNTFVHEISHLVNHIATYYKISSSSEEYCYIAGDIAEEMYKCCNKLINKCVDK